MSKKSTFSGEIIHGLGILQGWKAIGHYIGRSGRTARRWFDNYHMPIRYSITGRPFALIYELDIWMVNVHELLEKEYSEERKKLSEHAAMMRSCKKKK